MSGKGSEQLSASEFMREALRQAELAAQAGEVPVGAVVVYDGRIIARAHNEVEKGRDATLHAEILACRRASEALGRWRLDGCALYVTLEPCSMCIGALVLARVPELYFGAWDPRQGAAGSLFDLSSNPFLPHKIEVFPEILKAECEAVLKTFFQACRS